MENTVLAIAVSTIDFLNSLEKTRLFKKLLGYHVGKALILHFNNDLTGRGFWTP